MLNSVIEKAAKARVASGGLIAAMLSRGLLGEVNIVHAWSVVTPLLSCFDTIFFSKKNLKINLAGTIPFRLG